MISRIEYTKIPKMKEIIDKVIEKLESGRNSVSKIEKSGFKPIHLPNSSKQDCAVVFIDGGQAEILRAVDFSLQHIRAAAVFFRQNKRASAVTNEFFAMITSSKKEGAICFDAELFSVKGNPIEKFSIDSLDKSIMQGKERAEISSIGNIIRRFSELQLARDVCERLGKEDMIVLDGCLKSLVKGEDKYLQELFTLGAEKDVAICSLAKTSRRFSEDGSSIIQQLGAASEDGNPWSYNLGSENDYEIFGVKLNKHSSHVFEFNIYKQQAKAAEKVLGKLAENSNDAVFPGYPYGLIVADKLARVSNVEKQHIFLAMKTRMGKKFTSIEKSLNCLNSHDILDRIG